MDASQILSAVKKDSDSLFPVEGSSAFSFLWMFGMPPLPLVSDQKRHTSLAEMRKRSDDCQNLCICHARYTSSLETAQHLIKSFEIRPNTDGFSYWRAMFLLFDQDPISWPYTSKLVSCGKIKTIFRNHHGGMCVIRFLLFSQTNMFTSSKSNGKVDPHMTATRRSPLLKANPQCGLYHALP